MIFGGDKMAKISKKLGKFDECREWSRETIGIPREAGLTNVIFFFNGKCWNARSRYGGARPDFPSTFHPTRCTRPHTDDVNEQRISFHLPLYWHNLNITGEQICEITTWPVLSVHYPSVMSPFYTMAVQRYALAIDQFLQAYNVRRTETTRPFAADAAQRASMRLLRITGRCWWG